MNREPSPGVEPGGEGVDGWPARIAGVVETVVATGGSSGRWNQAALGISVTDDGSSAIEPGETSAAVARTFGRTRTRRNFDAGRRAYVQFTRDPMDFVDAALSVYETDEPILASADAWTELRVTERRQFTEHGTEVVEWALTPVEAGVRRRGVPTTNRGRAAAIEATVPASRLDVEGYEEAELLRRLERLADVVAAAGGERSRAAFERIDEHVDWRDRLE